jgi:hypothetical protein
MEESSPSKGASKTNQSPRFEAPNPMEPSEESKVVKPPAKSISSLKPRQSPRFEIANPMDGISESNVAKSNFIKSTSVLKPPSQFPSYADIKQTSGIDMERGEEDEEEFDEPYGQAQSLGIHAPKKSAGNMSRMSRNSKNSAASSDRGDRLNELFVMPFIRAASRLNESRMGRFVNTVLNKVTTKVFFWSFLSLANISVILLIFTWASGES